MKIPKLRTKDFISVADLSKSEIFSIYEFTTYLKNNFKKGKFKDYLHKKTLAMIFEKSSTRTRVSFEAGVAQLGGHALFLSGADIQIGRGETIADTARTLSRYVNGIMIRTFNHDTVEELAEHASIPVINGLTDLLHPCQALADFYTIYEREKSLDGVKLAYVGDSTNVANSLMVNAAVLGIDISVASPNKYKPSDDILLKSQEIAKDSGSDIIITTDIDEAVNNANYIYTDVWVSMGQEKQASRRKKTLSKYRITWKVLEKCAPGCMVMHCLPAHRGEEIDAEVLDSYRSIVFDQAENRMHVQNAVMCSLMYY